MKLKDEFTVVDVKELAEYKGIQVLDLDNGKGLRVYLEYPVKIVRVQIDKNSRVILSIDNVKDVEYKKNWDVYMTGIVYHKYDNNVRISIGGFIVEVKNYVGDVSIGEKVYVGIKRK